MRVPDVRLRTALVAWAALVVALVVGHVGWIGDHIGRDLSNVSWVLAPAVSTWLYWMRVRRFGGSGLLHPAYGLLAVPACWTLGNLIFAWYEIVLDRPAPSPSPADVFYLAALVLCVVACAGRLWALVSHATAVRAALDGTILGASTTWVVWWLLLRSADHVSFLWLYPALGIAAASLAAVVMTRIATRYATTWLLAASAFLVLAIADASWAYRQSVGTFFGGGASDVLWPAGYLLFGMATLAMPSEAVAGTRRRELNSWWELVLPYPTVVVAFAIGAFAYGTLDARAVAALFAIALTLVVRQVLSQWENHQLARTLEARVAVRTLELQDREEHFRAIVQGISDVIVVMKDGIVDEVTPSITKLLGYTADELVGSYVTDLVHPADLAAARARGEVTDVPGSWAAVAVRLQRADGTWCAVECRFGNLIDNPAVAGVLVTFRDVTERHGLEERLRTQANHDELTGLANRRHLQSTLEEAVASGRTPSLVLLDLDDFKAVNDSAGHHLGDRLLVAVADRLRRCTRPSDLVARLGGDEFAVVVVDDPDADVAGGIARRLIEDLSLPLRLDGHDVRCAGSAGVASLRADAASAEGLIRDADVAMYEAKRRGKGRFEVFTDAMHQVVLERQRVVERLRVTIDDGRLALHYQPIVDLATGTVTGAEALVRLPLADGTLLLPGDFIGVAEETGLIGPLGAWVLRTACNEASAWQELRPDGPPLSLSVNVATRQLADGGLPALVSDALERSGLAPHLLTLEITEGALVAADDGDLETQLLGLRALGVRLSIDDFGAGHSSLGRLRELPVDELKIDRSFVAELANGADLPLVEVVLDLARRLGLDVVAEGIEDPAQARILAALGCAAGQGFLYAEPAPGAAMASWVATSWPPALASLSG